MTRPLIRYVHVKLDRVSQMDHRQQQARTTICLLLVKILTTGGIVEGQQATESVSIKDEFPNRDGITKLRIEMTFDGLDYIDAYTNLSNPDTARMIEQLNIALDPLYSKIIPGFKSMNVIQLRPGTLVVVQDIFIQYSGKYDQNSVIKKIYTELQSMNHLITVDDVIVSILELYFPRSNTHENKDGDSGWGKANTTVKIEGRPSPTEQVEFGMAHAQQNKQKSGIGSGALAAIVIAAIAVVATIMGVVLYLRRKKIARNPANTTKEPQAGTTIPKDFQAITQPPNIGIKSDVSGVTPQPPPPAKPAATMGTTEVDDDDDASDMTSEAASDVTSEVSDDVSQTEATSDVTSFTRSKIARTEVSASERS